MDLWSRGLGRRELIMDFSHYAIRRSDDGGIEILGVTEEPVAWEFRVHIGEDDVPGMVNMALARPVVGMFARKALTALATIWRRRTFEVQPGLEERVRAAHDHVVNRPRPNRAATRAAVGPADVRGDALHEEGLAAAGDAEGRRDDGPVESGAPAAAAPSTGRVRGKRPPGPTANVEAHERLAI